MDLNLLYNFGLSQADFFTHWLFPLAVLVASLAGSFHCVGMCGGLMLATTQNRKSSGGHYLSLAYHLTRGVSYVLFGILAGFFGQQLLRGESFLWISRVATILLTIVFVRLGWQLLRGSQSDSWLGGFFARLAHRLFPSVWKWPPVGRAMATGFLTGFLPCGWLYGFVLLALTAPTPIHGGVVLLAFWLGTLPALLAVQWGTQTLVPARWKKNIVGTFFILLGLVTLGRKWQPMEMPHTKSSVEMSSTNEASPLSNMWICR